MTLHDFNKLKVGDIVSVPSGFSGRWGELGLPDIPAQAKVIAKDEAYVKLRAYVFGNYMSNDRLMYERERDDLETTRLPNCFFKHKSKDVLYCFEADADGKPMGEYYSSFVNRGDGVYVVSNNCNQLAMFPTNIVRPLYKNEQYKLDRAN